MKTSDKEIVVTFEDAIEELEPVQENGYLIEDEELVAGLWHNLIDMSKDKTQPPTEEEWELAAKEWVIREKRNISTEESKRQFHRYFREKFGVEIFITCPKCEEGITRPRVNLYNQYFIGCSKYPECTYMRTREDREKMRRELARLKDKILDKAEEIMQKANKLLELAKKIKDYTLTYEDIREIKKEWSKYE